VLGRSPDAPAQGWRSLDPVRAAALGVSAALGATAFAIALSPRGYQQGSRLAAALLLGLLVSLLLLFALNIFLTRRRRQAGGVVAYRAMVGVLVLLLAAAGARALVSGRGVSGSGRAQAQQAFRRWTMQAVPLIVRYQDTLAADAPLLRRAPNRPVDPALVARIVRARRRLVALEPAIRQLVSATPGDLRPLMPLLTQAVALATAAQDQYATALAPDATGRRRLRPGSRALVRRGNGLLRRSQQAIQAFSLEVNSVGGQLLNG
jgi:hypothetical protein